MQKAESKMRRSVQNFSSEAWLLRGIGNARGELQLEDGLLSFTTCGFPGLLWFQRDRLERDAHQPGLADRIGRGESCVVFDARITDVEARFPWYYIGGVMQIRVGEAKYNLSFAKPTYGAAHHHGDIGRDLVKGVFLGQQLINAIRLKNAWKNALREQIR